MTRPDRARIDRRPAHLTLLALLAAAALSACSDSPAGGGSDDDAGTDTSRPDTGDDRDTDDTGDDDDTAPDVVFDADAGTPDADVNPGDVAPDAPTDTDAGPTDGSADLDGDFGDPCRDDLDCVSGNCVVFESSDDGTGLCTDRCSDELPCPDGFDCVFVTGSGADGDEICVPNELCIDRDGDGYGIGPDCLGLDCDDDDDAINPRADEACDGFDNDCDEIIDDNPLGTREDCATGFAGACALGRTACIDGLITCEAITAPDLERCDGIDNDCDDRVDTGPTDGPLRRDCFDAVPELAGVGECRAGVQTCSSAEFGSCSGQVLPAPERCDGLDNDCDGLTDEELPTETFYPDVDGDTFGSDAGAVDTCAAPLGYVRRGGDCDDDNDAVFPGALDTAADGIDQDCSGTEPCWIDRDEDGFSTSALIESDILGCDTPGLLPAQSASLDCNDDDRAVFPGAAETTGDGIDQNCDTLERCFTDGDADGYRTEIARDSLSLRCEGPGDAPASAPAGDCDDALRVVYPGGPELCDDLDNNCDLNIDEDGGIFPFWPDTDGDGFGDPTGAIVEACEPPAGYAANNLDCNDALANVSPTSPELPGDGIDQNCDNVERCYVDADGDGARPNASATVESADLDCTDPGEATDTAPINDCNDLNPAIRPGADELAGDGVDQNCDTLERCFVDGDGDGFRSAAAPIDSTDLTCTATGLASATVPEGDCDDSRADRYPGAVERPGDGVDQDCDTFELCFIDADNDGVLSSDPDVTPTDELTCSGPNLGGLSTPSGDCDDSRADIRPGAPELCDGFDNDCDTAIDGADTDVPDADGDTVRLCDDCDDTNASIPNGPPLSVSERINICVPPTCSGDGTTFRTLAVNSEGTIESLTVVVDLSHPNLSDVTIELVGPDNTRVRLFRRRGGAGDNLSSTTFDDASPRALSTGTAPFSGSWRPESPLSAFAGKPVRGTWRLEITDDYSVFDGAIRGWELRFDLTCP